MAIPFIFLTLAFIAVWMSNRKLAVIFYCISMLIGVFWFFFHITSALNIQL